MRKARKSDIFLAMEHFYGAERWTSKFISLLSKVQKLTRLAFMDIDVYIKYLSTILALRLSEQPNLRHSLVGHGTILRQVRSWLSWLITKFNKSFGIKNIKKVWVEWVIKNNTITIFMDGSKANTVTGSWIFSDDFDLSS